MKLLAFLIGYAVLMALVAVMIFGNAKVTLIDEEVTLVTLDVLPEAVLVLKRGPDPVVRLQHYTRQKPVATPAVPGKHAIEPGTTLPASCGTIKYYNSHFSREQLEDMRVAARLPKPSASQVLAIEACLRS